MLDQWRQSRSATLLIVFLVYFIENVLLTLVVPVIPDFLEDKLDENANHTEAEEKVTEGKIGVLFASKSLVQILCNPLVGYLNSRVPPDSLIFVGNLIFFISSIGFALGNSYWTLFLARSIHGVGSALAIVSGLALLSETYPEDTERSRMMGFALGGMAVGVLVGYPAGGFMYDFLGKAAPFHLAASLSIILALLILFVLKPFTLRIPDSPSHQNLQSHPPVSTKDILREKNIWISISSIGIATVSIATLEPCLPIWLHETIQPEEWQIGTAFIPDSVGYLIGTNLFGVVAPKIGRWICAFVSHLMICICCIFVTLASQMSHLIIPHFGIGLGIAVIDASLMPLLASTVDRKFHGAYGVVYALSQTTTCMAYGFGPFFGGWLMGAITFEWLIRFIGVANLCFTPLLILLIRSERESETKTLMGAEVSQEGYGTGNEPEDLPERGENE